MVMITESNNLSDDCNTRAAGMMMNEVSRQVGRVSVDRVL